MALGLRCQTQWYDSVVAFIASDAAGRAGLTLKTMALY